VTGERLLDAGVEAADLAPLRRTPSATRADDAEDDAHERQGDERDDRELPRDREHHDQHADHGEHRGDAVESDCCIVWVMLSMSLVTREMSSPRCTVEVRQRQAVDLRLDRFAQSPHRAHHDDVDDVALQPASTADTT
jgi:hypothetical protein